MTADPFSELRDRIRAARAAAAPGDYAGIAALETLGSHTEMLVRVLASSRPTASVLRSSWETIQQHRTHPAIRAFLDEHRREMVERLRAAVGAS